MHLQELAEHIKQTWVFDPKKYPVIVGQPPHRLSSFQATHALLHLVSETGKLSDLMEQYQHSDKWHKVAKHFVLTGVAKVILNALQIANAFEISAELIEEKIHATLRAANGKNA